MRRLACLSIVLALGCGKKEEPAPGAPTPAGAPASAPASAPAPVAKAPSGPKPPAKPGKSAPVTTKPTATPAATQGKNQPLAVGDAPEKPKQEDRGKLKLAYDGPDSPTRKMIREAGIFEKVNGELDAALLLPRDIPVTFKNCDEENAFYSPDDVTITMCNEIVDYYGKIFAEYADGDRQAAIIGALVSVYLHELGHAVINQFALPAVGREEDAADQLSAVILVASGDEGEKMALDGAESWVAEGETEGGDETPYWDAHSLNEQRFYNIMCLIYGANPDKYESLVSDKQLPEERADGCADEYQQISSSWNKLLKPYMSVPAIRMTLSTKRPPKQAPASAPASAPAKAGGDE
jgi:hypothetical protein